MGGSKKLEGDSFKPAPKQKKRNDSTVQGNKHTENTDK